MLDLNTLISLPLTNGGPSYTCEHIVQAMNGGGVKSTIFTPADRRRDLQTGVEVRSVVPRWARQLPFRPTNKVTSILCERALLKACASADRPVAAFLWGDVSPSLAKRLQRTGAFTVREKFNCAKAVAKDLLYPAYGDLGAPEAFPMEQYESGLIAAEMESLRYADMIFCPSPMVARSLRQLGVEEARLAATSYGFDPARLAGSARALPPIDGPTFIFVGAVCVRKGAHILFEAWRRANISGGRLVLLGRVEPLIAERYAHMFERPDIVHRDHIANVGDYYRSADVFVFPSLEEGGPQVTYEAAFCQLPSIVSEMGAGAIVRHGIEGMIVQDMTADGWAAALTKVSTGLDEFKALGQAAHERSLEFSWDRVGRQRRAAIEQAMLP